MAVVGKLFLVAVESDRGGAVASCIGCTREFFSRIVLDTEYPCKRPVEPDLGESGRRTSGIRRVGKRNVVRVRLEPACEFESVSAMNLENVARLERVDVFPEDANGARIVLHEISP